MNMAATGAAPSYQDEEARKSRASGENEPYCVDELCACDTHACDPETDLKPHGWEECKRKFGLPADLPFPHYLLLSGQSGCTPENRDFTTEYRKEYTRKEVPGGAGEGHGRLGPGDGDPRARRGAGLSPENRDFATESRSQFTQKQVPADGAPHGVAAFKDHKGLSPENRDFSTVYRANFTPKVVEGDGGGGAGDGFRPGAGVSPENRDFSTEHKSQFTNKSAAGGQLPAPPEAAARAAPSPENRDFSTEYRDEYRKKSAEGGAGGRRIVFDENGVPAGVAPEAWAEFVREHRGEAADACPVTKLPEYPPPQDPREHTFWDPVAKQWY